MVKNSDNFTLIVMGLILFFVFILPELEKKYKNDKEKFTAEIKSKNDKVLKVSNLKCKKECCNFIQWPVPHMSAHNKDSKYIPSNLNCGGGEGSGGCVCYTKEDKDYLSSRGHNFY